MWSFWYTVHAPNLLVHVNDLDWPQVLSYKSTLFLTIVSLEIQEYVDPRGATHIWVGQGCAAWASKPIPIFKGDFGQKGYPFLRIFLQNRPIFFLIPRFSGFSHGENPKNHVVWGSVRKVDTCFKNFLGKKRDSCLRISCKKVTH